MSGEGEIATPSSRYRARRAQGDAAARTVELSCNCPTTPDRSFMPVEDPATTYLVMPVQIAS